MQRFYLKLRARVVGFEQNALKRKSRQGNGNTASASPILTFIAILLFTILAIMEIDLHRDSLKALGLISEGGIKPNLLGP